MGLSQIIVLRLKFEVWPKIAFSAYIVAGDSRVRTKAKANRAKLFRVMHLVSGLKIFVSNFGCPSPIPLKVWSQKLRFKLRDFATLLQISSKRSKSENRVANCNVTLVHTAT